MRKISSHWFRVEMSDDVSHLFQALFTLVLYDARYFIEVVVNNVWQVRRSWMSSGAVSHMQLF